VAERLDEQWQRWLEDGIEFVAPPFFRVETTSVLRNKVFLNVISAERGEITFEKLRRLGVRIVDLPDLQQTAWEIARALNRPEGYDAQYLALAQRQSCEFWTSDRRLFNTVSPHLPWVRLIWP
jgi:predicted nucleic acid-binding protein